MNVRACFAVTLLLVAGLTGSATNAQAEVDHQGSWPKDETKVSLRFAGPRTLALQKFADASGWSLVLPSQLAGAPDVRLEIKDQDPKDVLDAVLDEGNYVATRKGNIVTVRPVVDKALVDKTQADKAQADKTAPGGDTKESSPAVSAPSKSDGPAEDRSVVGGNFVLERGERAHHLQVIGGKAEIYGEVTGDVTVTGGKAVLHDGARVLGDATVVGGKLEVERGARVDGHAGIVGGILKRHPGSVVGGKSVAGSTDEVTKEGGERASSVHDAPKPTEGRVTAALHRVGGALRSAAIMFVIGVLLFGLAGGRMERLQSEIAARPLQSVGLGVASSMLATLGLGLLCVTVVGIPVALLLGLGLGLGLYTSMIAVVSTLGRGLIGHRSKSPYAHLALGCTLLFALSVLPYVGPLAMCAVVFLGMGSFIATRGAGLFGAPSAS